MWVGRVRRSGSPAQAGRTDPSPPSTASTCPVMKELAGSSKKARAAATSRGSPMRFRACMAVLAFSAVSLPAQWGARGGQRGRWWVDWWLSGGWGVGLDAVSRAPFFSLQPTVVQAAAGSDGSRGMGRQAAQAGSGRPGDSHAGAAGQPACL